MFALAPAGQRSQRLKYRPFEIWDGLARRAIWFDAGRLDCACVRHADADLERHRDRESGRIVACLFAGAAALGHSVIASPKPLVRAAVPAHSVTSTALNCRS